MKPAVTIYDPVPANMMRKAGREPQVDAHGNIQLSGGALADELADIAHMLQTFEVTGGNGGVSHARTSATGRRPANERT